MKRIVSLGLFLLPLFSSAQLPSGSWTTLFNGVDLTGWRQLNGKARFDVVEGVLVGTTVAGEPNSFLATEQIFDDFILELEFKMEGTNSGIQFRSESREDYQQGRVHGYQVDFDPTSRAWTGGIYDEARRGWLYPLDHNPVAKSALKPRDWNSCRIECIGTSAKVWINDVLTASIIDDVTMIGFIALQIHSVSAEDVGKKTMWRNIRIKGTNGLKPSKSTVFTADLIKARQMNGTGKGFWLTEKNDQKRIDVTYEGKLITSYCWFDSVMKPVLHPINTIGGTTITREFPLEMKPGERADHPHQLGWFFTHESVNGLDFWNSSTAIPKKDRGRYGHITHTRFLYGQGWLKDAHLTTQAQWRAADESTLLEEITRFHFIKDKQDLIIDRSTELKAVADQVIFKDAKDALLGLRVARELELPNQWEDVFVLPDKTISKTKAINNTGATGKFLNSEGVTGEAIWGKRSRWICLYGMKDGKKISLAIIDHPGNKEYPTYWHARGYGLLSANPLGKSIFTEGKESLNLTLRKNEVLHLSYRFVIRDGDWMTAEDVNNWAAALYKLSYFP